MSLTCFILAFDIVFAFAFVVLLAVVGKEPLTAINTLRRLIYSSAAMALAWRAVDILESWRPISTIGATFNVVMTSALFTLAVVRMKMRLP